MLKKIIYPEVVLLVKQGQYRKRKGMNVKPKEKKKNEITVPKKAKPAEPSQEITNPEHKGM